MPNLHLVLIAYFFFSCQAQQNQDEKDIFKDTGGCDW